MLRRLIPAEITLDEFDGTPWVGVVPFYMAGVSVRGIPNLPWVSHFPEMNLRTYVTFQNKPGIWFFSLDAGNSAAVLAARTLVHLPYFWASMRLDEDGLRVRYSSRRLASKIDVAFRGVYGPDGPAQEPQPGTLEHFLTERYCLYTASPSGAIERLEIHHWPWPLQPATAEIEINTVAEPQGLPLPSDRPLLHFVRRLDVIGWGLHRVG
jgi:uncharacterized protein YqjF (DUF2071 family)